MMGRRDYTEPATGQERLGIFMTDHEKQQMWETRGQDALHQQIEKFCEFCQKWLVSSCKRF
jgi:hypothetical protein